MNQLRIAFARLRGFLFRNRLDRELSEEIESHVAMEVEENLRRGMAPDEARYAALRTFGGVAQVKEAYRDRRGFPLVEAFSQDLWYAARGLAKSPVFTAVVILTLALSIGVNTAIFTLFDLALRPLGVRDPATVVNLDYRSAPGANRGFSYPNYIYLRDHAQAFSSLVASAGAPLVMAGRNGPGDSQQISALFVSGNFFSVLGSSVGNDAPALGRTFTKEQDRVPGRDAFVILSYPFWKRRFGADPNVLGQTLRLSGVNFAIIGVTAREFIGLEARVGGRPVSAQAGFPECGHGQLLRHGRHPTRARAHIFAGGNAIWRARRDRDRVDGTEPVAQSGASWQKPSGRAERFVPPGDRRGT
jgi:hypothetical protein